MDRLAPSLIEEDIPDDEYSDQDKDPIHFSYYGFFTLHLYFFENTYLASRISHLASPKNPSAI